MARSSADEDATTFWQRPVSHAPRPPLRLVPPPPPSAGLRLVAPPPPSAARLPPPPPPSKIGAAPPPRYTPRPSPLPPPPPPSTPTLIRPLQAPRRRPPPPPPQRIAAPHPPTPYPPATYPPMPDARVAELPRVMLASPSDDGARAAFDASHAWVDGLLRFFARRIHPRGPTLLVTLALLSPVLVAGAAFLSRPDTGNLRIAASSSQGGVDKVEVFVDGQKRCEVIPCLVEGLTPGPKFVRVIATGFAPAQPITVAVEAGKEQFAVVSLGEPRAR